MSGKVVCYRGGGLLAMQPSRLRLPARLVSDDPSTVVRDLPPLNFGAALHDLNKTSLGGIMGPRGDVLLADLIAKKVRERAGRGGAEAEQLS